MNKYAMITGASRGIGAAIATALAKEGYHLYLICQHSKEQLQTLAHNLQNEHHISCTCFFGDIGDSSFVNSCFLKIEQLDVLVNNAGISHIGLFSDLADEDWNRILQTNLSSVFYTCRCAIPKMLQTHSGHIINISSVWGNVGASMEVAYSATKGGVNSLTKALAKELAPSGIQVNAIACGLIDTDMNKCFDEETLSSIIEEIPADRMGQTSEVAKLAVQLCESPAYLTGQIITIDGGWQ